MPRHAHETSTARTRTTRRRNAANTPPIAELTLHCIGESHACFFSGLRGLHPCWPTPTTNALPHLRSYRLGHFLAHSLTRPRHPARTLLTSLLRQLPPKDPILLCFGEIDCRNHVIKQAHAQRRPIEAVARDLGLAYAHAARSLARSRPLAFWAAPPTNDARTPNPEYPTVGAFSERLRATRAFNAALHESAAHLNATFLDITPAITTRAGRQRPDFFCDEVHLAPAALPAAVAAIVDANLIADADHARDLVAAANALARVPAPAPAAAATPAAPAPPHLPPHLPPHNATYEAIKSALIDRAALFCQSRGHRRIALYGAGRHTREMGLKPFQRAGIRVVCILDDAPTTKSLLNIPIRHTADPRTDFDAVVISSDAHEDSMADLAQAIFKPRGIPTIRIYGWQLNK